MATPASHINRRAVMQAAWGLMRSHHNFGQLPFRSIGRACFRWCLHEAWRRAREAARLAALTVGELVARIEAIKAEIHNAQYADSFVGWAAKEAPRKAELARLIQTARSAGLNISA